MVKWRRVGARADLAQPRPAAALPVRPRRLGPRAQVQRARADRKHQLPPRLMLPAEAVDAAHVEAEELHLQVRQRSTRRRNSGAVRLR